MKNILIALFLLVALTVDVPANENKNDKPFVGISSGIQTNGFPCGLNSYEKANNALARAMKRIVLHESSCNVIYVINSNVDDLNKK